MKPSRLGFRLSSELEASDTIVGQERAMEAIDLAIGMAAPGYNVFALGPPGIGKMTALHQSLRREAATIPVPDDWCYVHDFDDPQRPDALRLPPGRGVELREAMSQFVLDLQVAIVALFEAESYQAQRAKLQADTEKQREAALSDLQKRASEADIALTTTPVGLAVAPLRDGKPIEPDEFNVLPPEVQRRYTEDMERFSDELQALLREIPHSLRQLRRRIAALDREVTGVTVRRLVDEVRARFADLPAVGGYLDDVERDVVSRAQELRAAASALAERGQSGSAAGRPPGSPGSPDVATTGAKDADEAQPSGNHDRQAQPTVTADARQEGPGVASTLLAGADPFVRYRVNVLVDHGGDSAAPFEVEDHPTQPNLVGRVEYTSQMGTLVTDFTQIRPGALHRANGGYLVMEAEKILTQPYAWDQLKRSLRTGKISIESVGQSLGLLTTTALDPGPIPLDVKVALTGDRRIYYLLCAYDPEFLELFKVQADFEETVDRSPDAVEAYAQLIASLAQREHLAPLDAAATARVIDELSRMAADSTKLSTHVGRLSDLLREADHLARRGGREAIAADDVTAAVAARRRRASRIHERILEAIERGVINIRTEGSEVGQVNALSVIQLGDVAFGHPSRVTASVRLGRGELVDIEREVELGGPIHSKGVLILAGFLGGRFGGAGAPGAPLSLHASLVFEQSYGGVEGDSASLAELCALLSAVGEVPMRQDVAVTGSVDQSGRAQAVGGVNEKIEGFFDACVSRDGEATHGVIIPSANVKDLMLADRVVEAARQRRFRVWPVSHVDQALALLTDLRVGRRRDDGRYPPGSVNGRVEARLEEMAQAALQSRVQELERGGRQRDDAATLEP
ncbi:MAG: AAA family ATPase [Chloroflexota bacterium]